MHEGAHAVAAPRAGRRVTRVSLGLGPQLLTRRLGGTTVLMRALSLADRVVWERAGATRAAIMLVLLAGPLAMLALAACVLALGAPATALAGRLVLFIGAVGLLPLVPGSDGVRAWAELRRPCPPLVHRPLELVVSARAQPTRRRPTAISAPYSYNLVRICGATGHASPPPAQPVVSRLALGGPGARNPGPPMISASGSGHGQRS